MNCTVSGDELHIVMVCFERKAGDNSLASISVAKIGRGVKSVV